MKWGEAVYQRHEGEWVRLSYEGRVLRVEANSYSEYLDKQYVFDSTQEASHEFAKAGLLLSQMGFTMNYSLEGF